MLIGALGIGLARVEKLMESHGRDVSVWNDGPGLGSNMTLEPSSEVTGRPRAETRLVETSKLPAIYGQISFTQAS
jgi:hypothetical protein